jgi:hypothetical protein
MNTTELNKIYKELVTYHNEKSPEIQIINDEFKQSGDMFQWVPDISELSKRYELGSKQINKLKRLDPNKKIIDAFDIDWYGYNIYFNGTTYKPSTTTELLELIFGLLGKLYNIYSDFDIIWNDTGKNRIKENTLNWVSDVARDEQGNPIKYKIYKDGDNEGFIMINDKGEPEIETDENSSYYAYMPNTNVSTVEYNTNVRNLKNLD